MENIPKTMARHAVTMSNVEILNRSRGLVLSATAKMPVIKIGHQNGAS